MFLPVKDAEFNDSIVSAAPSEPVFEHSEDKDAVPVQKKDKKTGLLHWQVNVMYQHANDFAPEVATVKLKSVTDPRIVAGPIKFDGLAFRTWDMGGKKGLSIMAESFSQSGSVPATPPKPSASDKK